ncbi:MAG: CHRD domain-containing protein [Pseudomonadota bacterium]
MIRSIILAALLVVPVSAEAAVFSFTSTLSGDQEVPPVSTDASGTAKLTVDDEAETLDFSLQIIGFGTDDLFDALVAAPVGPVHLHNAPAGSNGPIVVPFAFDPSTYVDTTEGFDLSVTDYAFADAAALAGSDLSFDAFLAGLLGSEFYINVHTDAFNSGELRGQVSPVPLPASVLLMIAGLGGLAVAGGRRRT